MNHDARKDKADRPYDDEHNDEYQDNGHVVLLWSSKIRFAFVMPDIKDDEKAILMQDRSAGQLFSINSRRQPSKLVGIEFTHSKRVVKKLG